MRGGGGGGAAQDGVGCLAVFFSQEPTPSSMTDTWDPKTAGLEGPSRNELPTRALCQALKVGFFVNIVITLLRGRYRYPHFSEENNRGLVTSQGGVGILYDSRLFSLELT